MRDREQRRKKIDARCYLQQVEEWSKWSKEIPFVAFDKDWLVKAIPAFTGAIIRYNIKHKDKPNSFVSVYLDCYDELGCVGKPYWEVHPVDGDCERCLMDETDTLLAAIKKSLDQQ